MHYHLNCCTRILRFLFFLFSCCISDIYPKLYVHDVGFYLSCFTSFFGSTKRTVLTLPQTSCLFCQLFLTYEKGHLLCLTLILSNTIILVRVFRLDVTILQVETVYSTLFVTEGEILTAHKTLSVA